MTASSFHRGERYRFRGASAERDRARARGRHRVAAMSGLRPPGAAGSGAMRDRACAAGATRGRRCGGVPRCACIRRIAAQRVCGDERRRVGQYGPLPVLPRQGRHSAAVGARRRALLIAEAPAIVFADVYWGTAGVRSTRSSRFGFSSGTSVTKASSIRARPLHCMGPTYDTFACAPTRC